jgi:hypothetical protein
MGRCLGKTKDNHQCIRNLQSGLYCKSHSAQAPLPLPAPVPVPAQAPVLVVKELPTLYDLVMDSIECGSFYKFKSVKKNAFQLTSLESGKARLVFHGIITKVYTNSVFVYKPRFLTLEMKKAWRRKQYRMFQARQEFARRICIGSQIKVQQELAASYGNGFLSGSAYGQRSGIKSGMFIGFLLSLLLSAAAFARINSCATRITA